METSANDVLGGGFNIEQLARDIEEKRRREIEQEKATIQGMITRAWKAGWLEGYAARERELNDCSIKTERKTS